MKWWRYAGISAFSKKEFQKVSGDQYEILSSADIIASENLRHGKLGKYIETISHHVALATKKQVYFQSHLWGL